MAEAEGGVRGAGGQDSASSPLDTLTQDYIRHVSNAEAAAKKEDWKTAFRETSAALRDNAAMIGVFLQISGQLMDGIAEIRKTYSTAQIIGLLDKKKEQNE